MTDTRVLVVADNLLARVGIAALLSPQQDITVVGQSAGGERLFPDLEIYRPDAVIYDLGYDPAAALPQLAILAEARMPVVALLLDGESAASTAAMFPDGVYGLLLRDSEVTLLTAALHAVAAGLVTLDPLLAAQVRQVMDAPALPPADDLTPREFEVLQLLAEGLTNKAIAVHLGISANTVKFHINAILQKLGAQSRTEAVVRASRLGMILL